MRERLRRAHRRPRLDLARRQSRPGAARSTSGGRGAGGVTLGPAGLPPYRRGRSLAAGEISGPFPSQGGARTGAAGGSAGAASSATTRRLILPAFGAYAGGLDVREPAIAGLFGQRTRIHILGQSRLHSFMAGQLAYLT